MLKQFLASTAIVALMAGSTAVAQSSNMDAQQQQQQQTQAEQPAAGQTDPAAASEENREMMSDTELLASEFIGMSVYNSTADDAEEIATVEDVLMSQDGQMVSVVLNTGGFFGLGGDDYAVPLDRFEITKRDGEFWVTSDIQKAELEGMTVFVAERPSDNADVQQTAQAPQGSAQTGAAPVTGTATEQAANQNAQDMAGQTDNQMAASNNAADTTTTGSATTQQDGAATTTTTTTTPMNEQAQSQGTSTTEQTNQQATQTEVRTIDEAQYATEADVEALTAENLMDVTVVGANNEEVGDVSDILLSAEGKVEAMVIDVGGFLGIGAKPVAVAYEDLNIRQNEDGDLVLFTQFTQEKLEGAAEYDEAAYQSDPTTVVVNPNE